MRAVKTGVDARLNHPTHKSVCPWRHRITSISAGPDACCWPLLALNTTLLARVMLLLLLGLLAGCLLLGQ